MTELVKTDNQIDIVERVIAAGDLSRLTPAERVQLYAQTCKSLGMNPLTRPFEYIQLNGKLVLYARKDCTDQLRKIHGVSIDKPDVQQVDDLIIVAVTARDASGRTDSDLGVVKKSDMRGDVSNAMMKAVTKAKRRVTLSICGLGFLDESEVETIPDARAVTVKPDTGEIEPPPSGNGHTEPEPAQATQPSVHNERTELVGDFRGAIADAAKIANDLAGAGLKVPAADVGKAIATARKLVDRKPPPSVDEINAARIALEDATNAASKELA